MKSLSGNRKFVLTVLGLAVYLTLLLVRPSLDAWTVAGGITLILGAFVYGNVKEHLINRETK